MESFQQPYPPTMTYLKSVFVFVLIFNILSCKDDKKEIVQEPLEPGVSTFYFIRHAEKDRSDSENSDPELSQDGLGRAMHWDEILKDVELDAIYSTDYQRTAMTAAPISVNRNIDVQYYEPQMIDYAEFKSENLNKNILVIGHSNTTPEFVNQMLGEDKYFAMDDNDNGSLFTVQIVNGIATAQRVHINCNCPE